MCKALAKCLYLVNVKLHSTKGIPTSKGAGNPGRPLSPVAIEQDALQHWSESISIRSLW